MKEEKELEVRVNLHGNEELEQHGNWIDLATAEDVNLIAGEFKIISLGISMELPKGWYAEVLPRSSTFKRYGVFMVNGMGIIDNNYCGDNDVWGFPAFATRTIFIPKGTRIAQFQVVKGMPKVRFTFVEQLGNADRGGFGSSGT